jgi:MFS family permease
MAGHTDEGLAVGGEDQATFTGHLERAVSSAQTRPENTTSAADGDWSPSPGYANYVFWLMFCINLINYVDRWVFSLLTPLIQTDRVFCAPHSQAHYCINDFQTGLLGSCFLLVYAVGALPLGVLADRMKRKNVIAAGVAVWSAATMLTAFVGGFFSLLLTRALLGIGEASYNPAGISLLSSYFPGKRRAQILSRWAAGALAGFAVGVVVGGAIGYMTHQWRLAFLFAGPPGLILAFLMWKTREPLRHAADESGDEQDIRQPGEGLRPILAQMRNLLRIRTLLICIVVQAIASFVIAPSAIFFSPLLARNYHLKLPAIGGAAILLAIASIIGALAGGQLADRLSRRYPGGRLIAGGVGFLLAAPAMVLALVSPHIWLFIPFFLLTGAMLNMYSGPLNAAIQDAVPPAQRASAVALAFMLAHLFGDLAAPSIVGGISYLLDPVHQAKLAQALLIAGPGALVIAGVIGIWGSRFLARDRQRASGVLSQA